MYCQLGDFISPTTYEGNHKQLLNIWLHENHKDQAIHVGKDSSPMEHMGVLTSQLAWPMVKRLKLFGSTCLVGKNKVHFV